MYYQAIACRQPQRMHTCGFRRAGPPRSHLILPKLHTRISFYPHCHCLRPTTNDLVMLSAPTEEGDDVRLEIPEEAQKEIKEAVGKVFEMAKEPFW